MAQRQRDQDRQAGLYRNQRREEKGILGRNHRFREPSAAPENQEHLRRRDNFPDKRLTKKPARHLKSCRFFHVI